MDNLISVLFYTFIVISPFFSGLYFEKDFTYAFLYLSLILFLYIIKFKEDKFMHPLDGKWKIHATTPLMNMELVADMKVNPDGKTFDGSVLETKSNATYKLENCTVEGNAIQYTIAMKLGIIPMRITLNGTFEESDWTCKGEGNFMKMKVSYTGEKVVE